MQRCIICEAFPGHRGPHRSAREVNTLLFAGKQRASSAAVGPWQRLPDNFASTGEPLLASVQFTNRLDARHVDGIWLRADQGSLIAGPAYEPLPETYFAPAPRATPVEVQSSREAFRSDPMAVAVLDALPDAAMVLNRERQIVALNSALLKSLGMDSLGELLGARPGEAVGCVCADQAPGGCGTGPSCPECGAVNAILECLESHQPVARDCHLRTHADADGGALDLDVLATYLKINTAELVLLCLRDVSAEKRRQVLERVFFHDLLNTALEIHSVSRLMLGGKAPAPRAVLEQDLAHLTRQMMDELTAQRDLLDAERGELAVKLVEVPVPALLEDVLGRYRHHHAAADRELRADPVPDLVLRTDPTLLRRVLDNLVKNALEAVGPGSTVTLGAVAREGEVLFSVHNPGVMPEPVQRQIFQRSFSTKPGPGHGLGTHSARLLTERYLGGHLDFTSSEADGTTFTVTLPLNLE